MARTIEYDYDEVIKKATDVFWEHGYEATSMDMLVSQTGLNRRSMYSLFGDKQNFFHTTMEYYLDNQIECNLKILRELQGMASIEGFFRFVLQGDCKGCFFVNAATEKALSDSKAQEIIDNFSKELDHLFQRNLEIALETGDLKLKDSIPDLSKHIICTLHGLSVAVKIEGGATFAKAAVDSLLRNLKGL